MCLSTIEVFNVKLDKDSEGVGYKIFKLSEKGELHTPLYAKKKPLEINKWFRSKQKRISFSRREYLSGYHIFQYKKDAKNWWLYREKLTKRIHIRKVKFKDILATGMIVTNDMATPRKEGRCIVARQMMILEDA